MLVAKVPNSLFAMAAITSLKNCRLPDVIVLGFDLITIGSNRPVKQVNGNRMKPLGADISGHGFDIVV